MSIQYFKPLSFALTFFVSITLISQVDSLNNYQFITSHFDNYYDSIINSQGDSTLEGTGYKDYLRWKDYMHFRSGKQGDLNAYMDYIADYFEGTRNISTNDGSDWNYFGPKGIPENYNGTNQHPGSNGKGMITSIYIDPNNHNYIIAGSHNSGVWKTEDGGDSWYCMTDDNYKIHGVNSIIVDPNDQSTIIISTFNTLSDHSYGLFKSTDGGVTWSEMNEGAYSC